MAACKASAPSRGNRKPIIAVLAVVTLAAMLCDVAPTAVADGVGALSLHPWPVAGKVLGSAIIIRPGSHRTITVVVDLSRIDPQLDPDGEWEEFLRRRLCRSLPEVCVPSRQPRDPFGWVMSGTAIVISTAAHVRITRLQSRVDGLGYIVNGTIALVHKQALRQMLTQAAEALASDWAMVSRFGRVPVGFWTDETHKRVLKQAGLDALCYEAHARDGSLDNPRVFDSVAELRIVRVQGLKMKVEIRLPELIGCGRFARDLQHVGIMSDGGYARLELPQRGIFSRTGRADGDALIAVERGNCKLLSLNTYACQVSVQDSVVYRNLTCGVNAKSLPTTAGCVWRLRRYDEPRCWTEVAHDVDRDLHIFSTNCHGYTVGNRTYPLDKPAQLAVLLGAGENLTVGGVLVASAGRTVEGRLTRLVELDQLVNMTTSETTKMRQQIDSWLGKGGGVSNGDHANSWPWWCWAMAAGAGVLALLLGVFCGRRCKGGNKVETNISLGHLLSAESAAAAAAAATGASTTHSNSSGQDWPNE